MSDEQRPPPRLLETTGAAGDCVREVLAEQELLETPPRFALLRERRLRRVRRQRGLTLAGLAIAALVCLRSLRQAEPLPSISPEVVSRLDGHDEANRPSTSSTSANPQLQAKVASETPSTRPAQAEVTNAVSAKAAVARASAEPLASSAEHRRAHAAGEAQSGGDGGTAKACAELARGGAAELALACYAKLAGGDGMTAELALFEQARLEGKVLRRPERARLTLDEYRRRFPHGSLRAEVMLAQIDWLLASGDSARALELVDEALASGLLRERAAELEHLRSTLTATPAAGR